MKLFAFKHVHVALAGSVGFITCSEISVDVNRTLIQDKENSRHDVYA